MKGRFVVMSAVMVVAVSGWSAPAAGPGLAALASLQPGAWHLRLRGENRGRDLCLGDPMQLIQIRHPENVCSRFVISDTRTMAVVHYTCPGAGHGRTTVRVETPQLVQIQTQGIAANAPFDWDLEGRRIGECGDSRERRP